ncbi:MAG TPA: terminase large subunit [Gaiellales bacterium]|jgi:phage terminase large subunit-like protein|nr:terminase large subunit [Gaiellales bacterium]
MSGELDVFERFCARLVLEQGSTMRLEPFQRAMLADYFGGTVETLVVLPKKNGKSTLLAALGLFHLLVTEDAEGVIAAASRDQATILYDQAVGFVKRSPGLAERVLIKRGYRELRSARDDGRLRVLAADADTADGVIPTLALVDELHRQRSAGLYGVFRDGLGPRRGQLIAISTAGDAETSPLGQMRAAARKLRAIKRDGRHLRCASADEMYVMHEWALEPEDDRHDMAVVKLANPASWQTEEALALRHDSPSTFPSQWARFACGLWLAGDGWWIPAEAWAACDVSETAAPLQDGEAIALGFDGARTADATALVACRMDDGLLVPLRIWERPEQVAEWEVRSDEVDAAVASIMERFRVVRAYFDPPKWYSEIDGWAREYGDVVVRYHTNRSRMMAAVERFRTDVMARTLAHAGDPDLTAHVLNAQVREARGGYWLEKERKSSANKIDAAIAAVLAYEARCDALSAGPTERRRSAAFL